MSEPGFHDKVPAALYHADDFGETHSLSSSIANILLSRSPSHAWHAHPKLNAEWQAADVTSDMEFGSAAHKMLLEETTEGIIVVDADDWRTKAAQQTRDAARNAGCIPVLARRFAEARAMVQAAHEQIAMLDVVSDFATGSAEVTALWSDDGVMCRSRMDWLSDDRSLVIDYKTTDNAEPNAFTRRIASMGYDLQAAFYSLGVLHLTGKRPRFLFLAQETEPPYLLSCVELEAGWMDLANSKAESAIAIWKQCLADDKWPGYPASVATAIMPAWLASQWEEKSAIDGEVIDCQINMLARALDLGRQA